MRRHQERAPYPTSEQAMNVFSRFCHRRNPWKFPYLIAFAALSLANGSLSSLHAQSAAPDATAAPVPLHAMTQVNEAQGLGYFGDPYPIHLAPAKAPSAPQYFSGTTKELMTCKRPITPECFQTSPLTVTIADDLKTSAGNADNEFFDQINHNIFQTADGKWNMAVTLYLRKKAASTSTLEGSWTVIAHAHPADPSSASAPTRWVADTILVGSVAEAAKANYDGKYFEDGKKLYLIYSKRKDGTVHDGIVAQAMKSPKELDTSDPAWLLAPSTDDGGFNSEYFHINWAEGGPNADFKLIETGNISKIAGKYVMAYSTGDYQQLDYKTGIAFSDTLLPQQGATYRRILETDTDGVWGTAGHLEVRYLLQSEKEAWPNYVGAQVYAPGVPSVVEEPGGRYFLYFDGFLPSDAPPAKSAPKTSYNPKHRRPFYLTVKVNVPADKSVAAATDEELATWITVASQ
jgi:hypothetical protein